ncbi:MAG TPA: SCO family protein [Polyangiales bacterium]
MRKVRYLLWAAVVVAGVGLFAAHRINAGERTTKGELGTVPAFSLVDQSGRSLTDRELRGAVWVANFIFTRCPSACPMLTAKFKALQSELGPLPGVRFVSISVDPEHDTPQVLAAYAKRFSADTSRWSFVTGPIEEIEKTVVRGFKIHVGKPTAREGDPTLIDIMHGEHFVLVDREGQIRGYYRAGKEELGELKRDLQALVR